MASPAQVWLRWKARGSIAKPSVSSRSGWKVPSGAQWRCTSTSSPNPRPALPLPTTQAQRVASLAFGRIPASRSASSAATRPIACERSASRRSLRSSMTWRGSNPFTSAAMCTGKPLGFEVGDRCHPAAAGEERLPGGGDVVPERGHETQPGDGDAAGVSVMPAPARRSRSARWRPAAPPRSRPESARPPRPSPTASPLRSPPRCRGG